VSAKPIQVIVTATVFDKLANDIHRGLHVLTQLRKAGVPVLGLLWPIGVESGHLHITVEEDLDGSNRVFTWTPPSGYVAPAAKPQLEEEEL
jgi:hypothetical protein